MMALRHPSVTRGWDRGTFEEARSSRCSTPVPTMLMDMEMRLPNLSRQLDLGFLILKLMFII